MKINWKCVISLAIAFAICVALAGCNPYAPIGGVWNKADMSRYEQDRKECEFEAVKAGTVGYNDLARGWNKGSIRRACMESKGYTQVR